MIEPHVQKRLFDCGIQTVKDLYSKSSFELMELLDVSPDAVSKLMDDVSRSLLSGNIMNGLEMLEAGRGSKDVIRTMIPPLDAALMGGLPKGSITELVGPAGMGKTQFCLGATVMSCLEHLSNTGSVLYIDTEKKFSGERLVEIARARAPSAFEDDQGIAHMLDQVLVRSPSDSTELLYILENLQGSIIDYNIKLIIVDSIAALVRSEFGTNKMAERQKLLGKQASCLKFLAESFKIPILVTNQITTKFEGSEKGSLKAALGPMWAHAVNTRLIMSSYKQGENDKEYRAIVVAKSPQSPNLSIAYKITQAGVQWLEDIDVSPIKPGSVIEMIISDYERLESEIIAGS